MKAVIVHKQGKGYSLKTEVKCYWCSNMWYISEQHIKNLYPDFEYYDEIVEFTTFAYVDNICKLFFNNNQ